MVCTHWSTSQQLNEVLNHPPSYNMDETWNHNSNKTKISHKGHRFCHMKYPEQANSWSQRPATWDDEDSDRNEECLWWVGLCFCGAERSLAMM